VANSTWNIIFTQSTTGGGGSSAGNMAAPSPPSNAGAASGGAGGTGGGSSSSASGSTSNPIMDFFKQLLPFAGPLVFVIQAIRRSKIFSTFMDTFLSVFSAMIDILLIPLVPLLVPALKLLLMFLPYLKDISAYISKFIKNPWEGIEDIFSKFGDISKNIGEALAKIFPNFGYLFEGIGGKLDTMFKELGRIFGTAGKSIWDILTDDSKPFWTERLPAAAKVAWDALVKAGGVVWDTIVKIWNEEVLQALKEKFPGLFEAIQDVSGAFAAVKKIYEEWTSGDYPKWKQAQDDIIVAILDAKLTFNHIKFHIEEFLNTTWTDLKLKIDTFLATTWSRLKANFDTFMTNTWPGIESSFNTLAKIIKESVVPVFEDWSDRIERFSAFIRLVGDVLKLGPGSNFSQLKKDWDAWTRSFGAPKAEAVGGYISTTGLYQLHAGEEVIRPSNNYNYNTQNKPLSMTNNITVIGDLDVTKRLTEHLAYEVSRAHLRNW
jgi:hypothetical protein